MRRLEDIMKHVGLNMAMDAYVNSALTGVNGGLVADETGSRSIQSHPGPEGLFSGHLPAEALVEGEGDHVLDHQIRLDFVRALGDDCGRISIRDAGQLH